ncbi:MAG: hypothetical protein AB7S94_11065 [Simkaniaceae bacterium]
MGEEEMSLLSIPIRQRKNKLGWVVDTQEGEIEIKVGDTLGTDGVFFTINDKKYLLQNKEAYIEEAVDRVMKGKSND